MTTALGTSSGFLALYESLCDECGKTITIGSLACRDRGGTCHADCVGAVISNKRFFRAGKAPEDRQKNDEPTYVVYGARKPARCGTCHLEHSGDCW